MRNGNHPGRYILVLRAQEAPPVPGVRRIRRYGLARVGVARRSALGVDRHERLERVAAAERRGL